MLLRPRRPPTSSRSILRLELGLKVVQLIVKPLRTLRPRAIKGLRVSERLKITENSSIDPRFAGKSREIITQLLGFLKGLADLMTSNIVPNDILQ